VLGEVKDAQLTKVKIVHNRETSILQFFDFVRNPWFRILV